MHDILSVLDRFFSEHELIEFVSTLAKFHRIQGSRDLEKAAKYIEGELRDLKNFNVSRYTYEYSARYGLHPPVIGWDVDECYAELIKPYRRILSSHLYSKVCAVAHSPPGDIEGEVVYVGEGTRRAHYKDKNVDDKIVLAYGNPYLVYKVASEFNVKGFLLFKFNVHENAIPYLSLFLSPEEAAVAKAPAAAISRRHAYSMINMLERGLKPLVRIYIKAEYLGDSKINVVEAALGEGEEEIHVFAHYCHPAGTVNDNISGSATLLELVKAFDRALNKDSIDMPESMKMVFIWFPEYYGSLPYILDKVSHKASRIVFGVNLDMIGEKQEKTKSTLNVIRPPIFISNIVYESILVKYLIESLSINRSFSNMVRIASYRFDINPYDGGSDHDIYLQFSIPSIMVNQWPDIYYHTDLDSIDKFDSVLAKRIGIGVGSALYMIASNKLDKEVTEILSKTYKEYVDGYTKFKFDINVLKNIKTIEEAVDKKSRNRIARFRYIGDKGVLMLRTLARFCTSIRELEDILEILEKPSMQFLFTHYIPLLLMYKPLSISEIKMYITLEYGIEVDETVLNRMIKYLKQFKLVEEIFSN